MQAPRPLAAVGAGNGGMQTQQQIQRSQLLPKLRGGQQSTHALGVTSSVPSDATSPVYGGIASTTRSAVTSSMAASAFSNPVSPRGMTSTSSNQREERGGGAGGGGGGGGPFSQAPSRYSSFNTNYGATSPTGAPGTSNPTRTLSPPPTQQQQQQQPMMQQQPPMQQQPQQHHPHPRRASVSALPAGMTFSSTTSSSSSSSSSVVPAPPSSIVLPQSVRRSRPQSPSSRSGVLPSLAPVISSSNSVVNLTSPTNNGGTVAVTHIPSRRIVANKGSYGGSGSGLMQQQGNGPVQMPYASSSSTTNTTNASSANVYSTPSSKSQGAMSSSLPSSVPQTPVLPLQVPPPSAASYLIHYASSALSGQASQTPTPRKVTSPSPHNNTNVTTATTATAIVAPTVSAPVALISVPAKQLAAQHHQQQLLLQQQQALEQQMLQQQQLQQQQLLQQRLAEQQQQHMEATEMALAAATAAAFAQASVTAQPQPQQQQQQEASPESARATMHITIDTKGAQQTSEGHIPTVPITRSSSGHVNAAIPAATAAAAVPAASHNTGVAVVGGAPIVVVSSASSMTSAAATAATAAVAAAATSDPSGVSSGSSSPNSMASTRGHHHGGTGSSGSAAGVGGGGSGSGSGVVSGMVSPTTFQSLHSYTDDNPEFVAYRARWEAMRDAQTLLRKSGGVKEGRSLLSPVGSRNPSRATSPCSTRRMGGGGLEHYTSLSPSPSPGYLSPHSAVSPTNTGRVPYPYAPALVPPPYWENSGPSSTFSDYPPPMDPVGWDGEELVTPCSPYGPGPFVHAGSAFAILVASNRNSPLPASPVPGFLTYTSPTTRSAANSPPPMPLPPPHAQAQSMAHPSMGTSPPQISNMLMQRNMQLAVKQHQRSSSTLVMPAATASGGHQRAVSGSFSPTDASSPAGGHNRLIVAAAAAAAAAEGRVAPTASYATADRRSPAPPTVPSALQQAQIAAQQNAVAQAQAAAQNMSQQQQTQPLSASRSRITILPSGVAVVASSTSTPTGVVSPGRGQATPSGDSQQQQQQQYPSTVTMPAHVPLRAHRRATSVSALAAMSMSGTPVQQQQQQQQQQQMTQQWPTGATPTTGSSASSSFLPRVGR